MCAALRGESVPWPLTAREDFNEAFIRRADYQGVMALLHEHASRLATWPPSVRDVIRRHTLGRAVWELRHRQLLTEAVAALRAKNIEPVLFKGTALAYGLYPNPVWRSRGDTDMIVAPEDGSRASEALVALGFRRDTGVSGEFVSYQDSYTKEIDSGRHTIDLHRRINNSELLARLFSYAELRAKAYCLPELCDGALAAGPVHALLLACLHPATHKQNPYYVDGIAYCGGDRLIWFYDVHLLLQSFTQAKWQEFVEQATAKGLCAISLYAIDQAAACYGTRCPDLAHRALTKTRERVATYLSAGRLRQSWIDFSAIPGLANRLRFACELVVPPRDYMRAKYPQSPEAALPWLYTRRVIEGVIRRLKPTRRTH